MLRDFVYNDDIANALLAAMDAADGEHAIRYWPG